MSIWHSIGLRFLPVAFLNFAIVKFYVTQATRIAFLRSMKSLAVMKQILTVMKSIALLMIGNALNFLVILKTLHVVCQIIQIVNHNLKQLNHYLKTLWIQPISNRIHAVKLNTTIKLFKIVKSCKFILEPLTIFSKFKSLIPRVPQLKISEDFPLASNRK